MAGEAITQLIFFIGAVVIASGVIFALITSAQSVAASYLINGKTLADQLKSEITIINDPQIIPCVQVGSTYTYNFFVKNTGKNTLDNSSVNMFIDRNYVINVTKNMTIMDGGSVWYPAYVLRLNYTTTAQLSSGDHTARVVAGNGVLDTMPFKGQGGSC